MYRPCPGGADEGDLSLAGHGNPGQFGGRVRMGEAAAHGAAVADLVMRDMGDCLLQKRMCGLQPLIVLDVAPAHPGAETNAAVAHRNVAEPGNLAQIDQHARRRQPEGEHWHQALPAGDHGRLGIGCEQIDRFPQRRRRLVLEGSGFHPSPRKASPINSEPTAPPSTVPDGGTRVAMSQLVLLSAPAGAVPSPYPNDLSHRHYAEADASRP